MTALTAGIAPLPEANAAAVKRDVDLQAGVHIFPPPDQIDDLTNGLGPQVYNLSQAIGHELMTALVNNVNLAAAAEALGIDLETLAAGVLNQVLAGVLTGALGDLPVDLDPVFDALALGGLLTELNDALAAVGLPGLDTTTTLTELLKPLGLDLSDPLNLAAVPDTAGINVITAGPIFTLLKLFGVDLGWVPSFPNSVADEINGTEYLSVTSAEVDQLLNSLVPTGGLNHILVKEILKKIEDELNHFPSVVDLRVPIVVGMGLGAFAAGAAYQQVVDDLPNQPGGANYSGNDPLLGSFTLLPMVLIDNPGRANGGILARMYPLFRLVGIDTVTPNTQVQSSTDGDGLLNDIQIFGLALGGANLIPVKIDATAEYLPLSDFAAWPNPFTMANNVAAGLFPTYILRGQTLDGILTDVVLDQIAQQLGEDITDYLADPGDDPTKGPKLNIYITIPARSLPLLEPTYLAFDVINLLTGANLNNPIGTALSPLLTSLVNLGYTDVYYNEATGEYDRTLDEADVPTAFGTLPDLDWGQVPGHLVNALAIGVQNAIDDGLVNRDGPVPNVIATVLGLLGLDDALPNAGNGFDVSGLPQALENLTNGALDTADAPDVTTTNFEPQGITETGIGAPDKKTLNLDATADADDTEATAPKRLSNAADDAREQLQTTVKEASDRAKASAEKARERTQKAVQDAQDRINKVAENGRKQIKAVTDGVEKAVKNATDKQQDKKEKDAA
ncbi:AAA family ATPase [Mycolicibacterium wolinskyi]|uniref:AAA family ATPase n=1 Tax=Mycolicibacterium wolinskyi TaxID=59750 RepID=UPI0039179DD4